MIRTLFFENKLVSLSDFGSTFTFSRRLIRSTNLRTRCASLFCHFLRCARTQQNFAPGIRAILGRQPHSRWCFDLFRIEWFSDRGHLAQIRGEKADFMEFACAFLEQTLVTNPSCVLFGSFLSSVVYCSRQTKQPSGGSLEILSIHPKHVYRSTRILFRIVEFEHRRVVLLDHSFFVLRRIDLATHSEQIRFLDCIIEPCINVCTRAATLLVWPASTSYRKNNRLGHTQTNILPTRCHSGWRCCRHHRLLSSEPLAENGHFVAFDRATCTLFSQVLQPK